MHIPAPASDDSDDGDSDLEGGGGPSKSTKTPNANPISAFSSKHELENPPVPTVELEEVGPEEKMEMVGSIMSVVGSAVIVQAVEHGSHRVLDTGSVLAFENRRVLGAVRSICSFLSLLLSFLDVVFTASITLALQSQFLSDDQVRTDFPHP